MDSPKIPRLFDFAYRRRNKRDPTCSTNSGDSTPNNNSSPAPNNNVSPSSAPSKDSPSVGAPNRESPSTPNSRNSPLAPNRESPTAPNNRNSPLAPNNYSARVPNNSKSASGPNKGYSAAAMRKNSPAASKSDYSQSQQSQPNKIIAMIDEVSGRWQKQLQESPQKPAQYGNSASVNERKQNDNLSNEDTNSSSKFDTSCEDLFDPAPNKKKSIDEKSRKFDEKSDSGSENDSGPSRIEAECGKTDAKDIRNKSSNDILCKTSTDSAKNIKDSTKKINDSPRMIGKKNYGLYDDRDDQAGDRKDEDDQEDIVDSPEVEDKDIVDDVDDPDFDVKNEQPPASDDDDYTPSSANSSDSETKEWLNKAKANEERRAKKRRRSEALIYEHYSNKRRREQLAHESDSVRLMKCRSSLEMLKSVRQMRNAKKSQATTSSSSASVEQSQATTSRDQSQATRMGTSSYDIQSFASSSSTNQICDDVIGGAAIANISRVAINTSSSDSNYDTQFANRNAETQSSAALSNCSTSGSQAEKCGSCEFVNKQKDEQKMPINNKQQQRKKRMIISDSDSDSESAAATAEFGSKNKSESEYEKFESICSVPSAARDEISSAATGEKSRDSLIENNQSQKSVQIIREIKPLGSKDIVVDSSKDNVESEREENSPPSSSSSSSSEKSESESDIKSSYYRKSPKKRRPPTRKVILLSSDEEEDDVIKISDDVIDEKTDKQRPSSSASCSFKEMPAKLTMKELKKKAAHYFDTAPLEELICVPRCSDRVAESIIARRPFKTYENLIDTAKNAKIKGFTSLLIEGFLDLLKSQNDLDRVLYSCQKISHDLMQSVQNLLDGTGKTVSQPQLIQQNMHLKPYQLVGLNWLILMYKRDLSCVLADEMGLGKTIEVIAFLAHLKEKCVKGPHLIVVPSSTLDNWLTELRRWCPALYVLTYYGSIEDRKFLRNDIAEGRLNDLDIILSTYQIVVSGADDRAFIKRLNLNYAIFDEGHMLKNFATNRYRSLMKIRAKKRLLMTGTPLQNNLIQLISLMHFVMPDLFYAHTENLRDLLALFQCKSKSVVDYEDVKIEQAKNIMKPFVLRRLKTEVLSQLPKKHEIVEFCELTDYHLELYGILVSECSAAVRSTTSNNNNDVIAADQSESSTNRNAGGGAGPTSICGLTNNDARSYLMQFRKAANHPLLLRRLYTDDKLQKIAKLLCKEKAYRDSDPDLVAEDLSVLNDFEISRMCNKHKGLTRFRLPQKRIMESAKFQALDKILPQAKSEGNKVLLFSQFVIVLDIMEEYLKARKHKYVRLDGSTAVVERQVLIDEFNTSDDLFVFLLSTRAGGLGINLTSANIIILHDIDYNPYNDRQAEDRCHRVGQTKEVTVIRLIAKNTIDESMLACAQKKLELEKQVTSADDEDAEDPPDMETLLKQALKF